MNTLRNILSLLLAAILLAQCQLKDGEKKYPPDNDTLEVRNSLKVKKSELVHDQSGNIIERHRHSYSKKDSSILSYESYYYTYDDFGNVIHEIKESYSPAGELSYRNTNEYRYNSQNLKTEIIYESCDGSGNTLRSAHHVFKYNAMGHKIEDTGYRPDGSVYTRIIMEPDTNGNLLSEEFIQYNTQGEISEHKKFYYSEHGLQKTVDLMKND